MKHKIVSLYQENLNTEVVKLQKKVFDQLGINLIQYKFKHTHHEAINDYLDNNEWDVVTLFDVDCIPLESKCVSDVLNIIDDNTVYGNAQVSNSFPYAAPSFVSFTKKFYETSPDKSFSGGYYKNKIGHLVESDCGEIFIKKNLEMGKKQILSYPKSVLSKQWFYDGDDEYPKFEYGTGTLFENNTFHCFQIRLPEVQSTFIKYVNNFLNEN